MGFFINFILACVFCAAGNNIHHNDTFLNIPVNEIETVMNAHLDQWYPGIIDEQNGGYYSNFDARWQLTDVQAKMLVNQSRGLWTAAKAAQINVQNLHLTEAAHHGYRFLTHEMWDEENGGFKLYQNETNNKYKLIYGNAFALFVLAEYAKINPSNEVFQWLHKTFDWIENTAHDPVHGGYYNVILSPEMSAKMPHNTNEILKFGWGHPAWKDQNTSIHLLEAFTALYQVMPEQKVRTRLEELLVLIRDTMVQTQGSLQLFFENDWTPLSHADSSRNYIINNSFFDHVSFGHDIETAYLLMDASQALYGKIDTETLTVAKKLTDHSLAYGFSPEFYGIYDRGYYFNEDEKPEIIDRRKSWWAQFEAWHTLAIMAKLFPDEPVYETAFVGLWNYIENELHDKINGGYFEFGLDETPDAIKRPKAQNWKSNYHDGRALILVYLYAHEQFNYSMH